MTTELPRDLVKRVIDRLTDHDDCGPPGEGWQSELLMSDIAAMEAALAAPTAKGGTEVPTGWKLVPERPTGEMIHHMRYGSADALKIGIDESPVEGVTVFPNFGPELARHRYQAALAVAPPPPAGAAGGGSGDLRKLRAKATGIMSRCQDRALFDDEISKQTLLDAAKVIEDLICATDPEDEIHSAPTPDLGAQGEPVAWQGCDPDEPYDPLKCAIWAALVPFQQELLRTGGVTFMGLRNAIVEAVRSFAIASQRDALAPAAPRTGSGVSAEIFELLGDVKRRLEALAVASGPEGADPDELLTRVELALFAQAPRDGGETQGGVTLTDLHAANIARQAEWCPDQLPDLSFRGNELAGETGEACNVIKKLERERQGWRGSRATLGQLAEELADVVICADLCAVTAGINLDAAVREKFNATSEKVGLATKLLTPPSGVETIRQDSEGATDE